MTCTRKGSAPSDNQDYADVEPDGSPSLVFVSRSKFLLGQALERTAVDFAAEIAMSPVRSRFSRNESIALLAQSFRLGKLQNPLRFPVPVDHALFFVDDKYTVPRVAESLEVFSFAHESVLPF